MPRKLGRGKPPGLPANRVQSRRKSEQESDYEDGRGRRYGTRQVVKEKALVKKRLSNVPKRANLGEEAELWIEEQIQREVTVGKPKPRIFIGEAQEHWFSKKAPSLDNPLAVAESPPHIEEMDGICVRPDPSGKGKGKAVTHLGRLYIGNENALSEPYMTGEELLVALSFEQRMPEPAPLQTPDLESNSSLRRSRRSSKQAHKTRNSRSVKRARSKTETEDKTEEENSDSEVGSVIVITSRQGKKAGSQATKKRKTTHELPVPEFTMNHTEPASTSSAQIFTPPHFSTHPASPTAYPMRYGHANEVMLSSLSTDLDPPIFNLHNAPEYSFDFGMGHDLSPSGAGGALCPEPTFDLSEMFGPSADPKDGFMRFQSNSPSKQPLTGLDYGAGLDMALSQGHEPVDFSQYLNSEGVDAASGDDGNIPGNNVDVGVAHTASEEVTQEINLVLGAVHS